MRRCLYALEVPVPPGVTCSHQTPPFANRKHSIVQVSLGHSCVHQCCMNQRQGHTNLCQGRDDDAMRLWMGKFCQRKPASDRHVVSPKADLPPECAELQPASSFGAWIALAA